MTTNDINDDSEIRSKIIITPHDDYIINPEKSSIIELAAAFSKNDNNFDILKLLLKPMPVK